MMHRHELADEDAAEVARIRSTLLQAPPLSGGPEGRAGFDAMLAAIEPAEGVEFKPAFIAGVAGWWCQPQRARVGAVLYLHGGAFVAGSAWAYRPFVSHIATATRTAVFICDYALAPERPFPAAFEQVFALWGELARAHEPLAIVGDSAGGGLALSLASRVAHDPASTGGPQPRAVGLLSPWLDLTLSGASTTTNAERDLLLNPTMLATAASNYTGGHAGSFEVSPLFGRLDALPPVVIHVGDREILLDDTLRLAQRIDASGGVVETHLWAAMQHVFPTSRQLSSARNCIEMLSEFVRERMQPA